ncbi:hypothetical protein Aduo_018794 [Ancylostoma duodenale]
MSSVWKFYKRTVKEEDRRECVACKKTSKVPKSSTINNLLSDLNNCEQEEMEKSTGDSHNGSESGSIQQKLEVVFKGKLNSRTKQILEKRLVTFVEKSSISLNNAAEDYVKDFII